MPDDEAKAPGAEHERVAGAKSAPAPEPAPIPDPPRAGALLLAALRRSGLEIGKALIIAAAATLIALVLNAARGKAHGGLDLVARAPYDIYTDCPEMDENIPKLVVKRLRAGNPNLVFVDARPAVKYLAGHIPGARALPMYGTRPNAPQGLGFLRKKRGRFIVVYGQDEMQSAVHLASHLRAKKIRGVHLIKGDLAAWRKAGRKLAKKAIPRITAAALKDPKGVRLVDARPKTQYGEGHLPGAQNLPFNGLMPPEAKAFKALLSHKGKIVVYGTETVDPELADPDAPAKPKDVGQLLAAELIALGARQVFWLPAGCAAWQQAGGALEKSTGGAK